MSEIARYLIVQIQNHHPDTQTNALLIEQMKELLVQQGTIAADQWVLSALHDRLINERLYSDRNPSSTEAGGLE